MATLFTETYDAQSKFIFDFYDFDKDGYISKEDVRLVLSYIPLKTKKMAQKDDKYVEDYKDRIESQDELHELLEKCFKNIESMDYKGFNTLLQTVSSDIFLFILIFIMEKRPFSSKTLDEFAGIKSKSPITKSPVATSKILLASPNMNSKFTPSDTISKSPMMSKRNTLDIGFQANPKTKTPGNNFLGAGLGGGKPEARSILNQLAGKKEITSNPITVGSNDNTGTDEATDENVSVKNIPVNRKQRNNLRALEDVKDLEKKAFPSKEYDLPITPAVKQGSEE